MPSLPYNHTIQQFLHHDRKFLIRSGKSRNHIDHKEELEQYWMESTPDHEVIYRRTSAEGKTSLYNRITKQRSPGMPEESLQLEFITKQDYLDYADSTGCNIQRKTPYYLKPPYAEFSIDEFHDHNGQLLAELDNKDGSTPYTVTPDWIGKEVTNNPAYSSRNISENGFPEKPRSGRGSR